jgi:serine/threonine protein kinase
MDRDRLTRSYKAGGESRVRLRCKSQAEVVLAFNSCFVDDGSTKLNRPAAIKFLSNDLADQDARRRFQREAQMVSSLNHPHILTVHDAGEVDGRQQLVTEFVDGGTLKDWRAPAACKWEMGNGKWETERRVVGWRPT